MNGVRNILSTDELSPELVTMTMARAEELRSTEGHALRESQELLAARKVGGLSVYVAMFEPSTRTADAQTLAAMWLGMHVRNRDTPESSSLKKGESKSDMITNIVAQGYDAVVIRDKNVDTPRMASSVSEAPIINAGNGYDDHPTQAIADIYTVFKEIGAVENLTVVIAGDNYNGRVNRADARMFSKFGNKLVFASLPGMEMDNEIKRQLDDQGTEYHEVGSLIDAMEFTPEVVILSRFQRERYEGINRRTGDPYDTNKIEEDYHRYSALTPEVLKAAPQQTKILHPLPRGPELPDDSDSRVVIWPQVKNAVWTRVAGYEYVFNIGPFEDEPNA
jgi:aspartate carbamoyltransferase catalytic subunit